MHHAFIEGHAASYVWNLIENALGITYHPHPIRYILKNWCITKAVNDVHMIVLDTTPIVICWFL